MTPAPLRHPAAVAVLALLLAAGPASPPALAQAGNPDSAPSATEPEGPSDPQEAPPSPADLSAAPRPSLPADLASLGLGPDFTRLPIGGWRLGGRSGQSEPDHEARLAIETIGRYLAQQSRGRVTIIAQTSGPADDPSVARRTSLARAITVKSSLVRGGLAGTRIDIRPMGRTDEELDAVDIVAPPAPRPREAAAPATPTPAPTRRGG
ncbi:hypothetical protein SAMN02745194_02817 [Roseomonas rosea]|uniref:OmpA family protein n=1 Tax=Muricoccus roseus TaxID=198092 RepID=A0A1M6K4H3_9PROT|nr:hypothetical protein [Roseomonas rosea]SHJ53883.1 hypothetical protein SAMN02745194_02817 [Roseomonas rosea]